MWSCEEQHHPTLPPHKLSSLADYNNFQTVWHFQYHFRLFNSRMEKSDHCITAVHQMTPELSVEVQEHNINSVHDKSLSLHRCSSPDWIYLQKSQRTPWLVWFSITLRRFSVVWCHHLHFVRFLNWEEALEIYWIIWEWCSALVQNIFGEKWCIFLMPTILTFLIQRQHYSSYRMDFMKLLRAPKFITSWLNSALLNSPPFSSDASRKHCLLVVKGLRNISKSKSND